MNYATIMVHLNLARSNASLLAFTADLANRTHATFCSTPIVVR